jgi:hypothetical protein
VTVEETALAVAALASAGIRAENAQLAAGLDLLAESALDGRIRRPEPVGLYFASLWYSEIIYPAVWSVEAFRLTLGGDNLL